VLDRVLDESYAAEVRSSVTALTVARLTTNAAYRFPVPFLATIADGLHVSLGRIGVGLAITELFTLSAPLVGRAVERATRRAAMLTGLAGVALGALIAGASSELWMFVVGLAVLSLAKMTYDVGLNAFIADRVPFAIRSRVTSLTETSWALGMLLGVSSLGLVVAVSSWNVAYVVVAVAVVASAGFLRRRLPPEQRPAPRHSDDPPPRWAPRRVVILTSVCIAGLAGSAQFVFVTYGAWLTDHFGFSAAALAGVSFAFGLVELTSSVVSTGRTDAWGKERSVVIGCTLMVPGAVVIGVGADHLGFLLAGLALFLLGFELAIISCVPLGAELTPTAPAHGLSVLIAAITGARALVVLPATAWYADHGLDLTAVGAATLAIISAVAISGRARAGISRGTRS
jgi:MFS transporter, YNFM family, putative membrane transport protein